MPLVSVFPNSGDVQSAGSGGVWLERPGHRWCTGPVPVPQAGVARRGSIGSQVLAPSFTISDIDSVVFGSGPAGHPACRSHAATVLRAPFGPSPIRGATWGGHRMHSRIDRAAGQEAGWPRARAAVSRRREGRGWQ